MGFNRCWTVFGLSGEWSGHGQGVHVCGAVCGAQPTDADEAATKARTVGFRIVFSLLKAMCCRKQLGEYTQGLCTNKMIVYLFLCSVHFLDYICLFCCLWSHKAFEFRRGSSDILLWTCLHWECSVVNDLFHLVTVYWKRDQEYQKVTAIFIRSSFRVFCNMANNSVGSIFWKLVVCPD